MQTLSGCFWCPCQRYHSAAKAIASAISDEHLHEDYIVPSIFDKKVTSLVGNSVAETCKKLVLHD
ncbi:MAG: hypothetical protein D6778_02620 [Nitrospirae bacterium]|nr:MAG: hypothetical protein D6778_02620 [Nitrospirota bacterium]